MFSFLKKPVKDLSKCRFDNDAYWKDIADMMPYDKRMKKMENLEYWVPVKDGESVWTFL